MSKFATSLGRSIALRRTVHPLVQPMLLFMLAGALAQAIVGALAQDQTTLVVASLCSVAFVVGLLLVRIGHEKPGALLALLVMLVGIEYAMWVGQGLHDIAAMELSVVVLLASLVLNQRQAILITALALASVAVFGAAEQCRLLPNSAAITVDPVDVYVAIIVLLALSALFHFFVQKLVRTEQRHSEIFNATHEAIFIHDAETGHVLDVNEPMLRMYDYTREELASLDTAALSADLPEFSQDRHDELVQSAANGEEQIFEWKARRKDGSEFWVEVTLRRSEISGQGRVLAVVRDIDARKHAEERAHQSDKLRALGQLAGGIAHDFNNQLAGIAGYAQLLALKAAGNPHVDAHTRDILEATKRAAHLTRQLLAFARQSPRCSVQVEFNAVVTEVVELLRRSVDPRIEITFEPTSPELTINCDPAQTHSAILNLCLNARDAMPEGGTLTLRTGIIKIEGENNDLDGVEPGLYGEVQVIDNGVGMTEAVRQRIFEPFYTTKTRGIGLGLATVYGSARSHGGFVRVESEQGSGSTFRLAFPLCLSEQAAAQVPASADHAKLELRVLLAEDELSVAKATRGLLEQLGCSVCECRDGEQAVSAFRQTPDDFDVVLLDLSMPRLSGAEALKKIRAINPRMSVVITSGYTADTTVQSLLEAGAAEFVAKPYTLETLCNALSEAVRRG